MLQNRITSMCCDCFREVMLCAIRSVLVQLGELKKLKFSVNKWPFGESNTYSQISSILSKVISTYRMSGTFLPLGEMNIAHTGNRVIYFTFSVMPLSACKRMMH